MVGTVCDGGYTCSFLKVYCLQFQIGSLTCSLGWKFRKGLEGDASGFGRRL